MPCLLYSCCQLVASVRNSSFLFAGLSPFVHLILATCYFIPANFLVFTFPKRQLRFSHQCSSFDCPFSFWRFHCFLYMFLILQSFGSTGFPGLASPFHSIFNFLNFTQSPILLAPFGFHFSSCMFLPNSSLYASLFFQISSQSLLSHFSRSCSASKFTFQLDTIRVRINLFGILQDCSCLMRRVAKLRCCEAAFSCQSRTADLAVSAARCSFMKRFPELGPLLSLPRTAASLSPQWARQPGRGTTRHHHTGADPSTDEEK